MVNFLDLPARVRDSVYRRVLTLPSPVYIFQEPGSRVETFAPDRPRQWLSLIYTSRQISREASVALYGKNQFHLVDITERQADLLQSFLECIGTANAASLSYLCINFPVAAWTEGQIQLRDDATRSLKLLRDRCVDVSTLETVVHSGNTKIFRQTDGLVRDTLLSIDSHFGAVQSLQRIVVRVEVHDGTVTAAANDLMIGFGWTVMSKNRKLG